MFRDFSMMSINGYEQLSNWQKNMFDDIYKKHIVSLKEQQREKYSESNIDKIEGEISILKVSFKNGDCFIYLPEKTWIKVP